MNLSKRIRQLRLERNLTAKELGNIINVADSTISLYENNKRTPNIDLILTLSDYFNVSVDYLLGKTDIKYSAEKFEVVYKNKIDANNVFENLIFTIKNTEILTFGDIRLDDNAKLVLLSSLENTFEILKILSNSQFNDLQNHYKVKEE